MSKELKAIVLAKCETCKTNQGGWMPVGGNESGLACEYFTDGGYSYFQIGSPHHSVCLKFNEETHSESIVWPLAAKILGVQEAKTEQSPSDALLWEAWKKACEFEFKDEFEQTDEEDAFNEWRATLPADPLKADSELEADKALADEVIWKDSEVSAGHMSSEIRLTLTATCNPLEVFEAIERLCK